MTAFLKNRFQNHLIQLRNEISEKLSLKGSEHVLILFSGVGFLLNSLAQKLTTGRVAGIDPRYASNQNGIAITMAEENARREGVAEKVELYSDVLSSLPFPNAWFDVAVMLETELLTKNPIDAHELIRVMKSGGKLYIRCHPATELIIANLLMQGFREHSEARLLHYQGRLILWMCLQKQ
jgi:ubiquinone/menaquinone biosynthesis C-methylase UbiE